MLASQSASYRGTTSQRHHHAASRAAPFTQGDDWEVVNHESDLQSILHLLPIYCLCTLELFL